MVIDTAKNPEICALIDAFFPKLKENSVDQQYTTEGLMSQLLNTSTMPLQFSPEVISTLEELTEIKEPYSAFFWLWFLMLMRLDGFEYINDLVAMLEQILTRHHIFIAIYPYSAKELNATIRVLNPKLHTMSMHQIASEGMQLGVKLKEQAFIQLKQLQLTGIEMALKLYLPKVRTLLATKG